MDTNARTEMGSVVLGGQIYRALNSMRNYFSKDSDEEGDKRFVSLMKIYQEGY